MTGQGKTDFRRIKSNDQTKQTEKERNILKVQYMLETRPKDGCTFIGQSRFSCVFLPCNDRCLKVQCISPY